MLKLLQDVYTNVNVQHRQLFAHTCKHFQSSKSLIACDLMLYTYICTHISIYKNTIRHTLQQILLNCCHLVPQDDGQQWQIKENNNETKLLIFENHWNHHTHAYP